MHSSSRDWRACHFFEFPDLTWTRSCAATAAVREAWLVMPRKLATRSRVRAGCSSRSSYRNSMNCSGATRAAKPRIRPSTSRQYPRRFVGGLRTEARLELRHGHVPGIADHVNELRGREQLQQDVQVVVVFRGLVTPSHQALAGGELLENRPQRASVSGLRHVAQGPIDVEDEAEVSARARKEAFAADVGQQATHVPADSQVAVARNVSGVSDDELAFGAEVDTEMIE